MPTLIDALAAAQAYDATPSITRAQYEADRDILPGMPTADVELAPYIALPSALWAQAIIAFLTETSISGRIAAYKDAFRLDQTPLPNGLLSDVDVSSDLINFGNFSDTLKWTLEDFIKIFIDNETEINALVTASEPPAEEPPAEEPQDEEPAPVADAGSCNQVITINITPGGRSYVINVN